MPSGMDLGSGYAAYHGDGLLEALALPVSVDMLGFVGYKSEHRWREQLDELDELLAKSRG